MKGKYARERKEKQPVVAICYDFDKTLSPDDMQAQGYIQSVGYDVAEFWKESNELAERNEMDQNLAYMLMMKKKAAGKLVFTRENLQDYGAKVRLFPGVEDWFERIRAYGAEHGVIVEHYIISSGLREIIEGCPISREFKEIFASEFYYNENGVAAWPKLSVNYTSKTQFVYRINKGVLDVSDDRTLNASMPDDSKRVPFTNMIYLGDGLSDVPCMKMMQAYGGASVAVYQEMTPGVKDLLANGRVDYIYPADYRPGSGLDTTIKNILRRMATADALAEESARQKQMIRRDDEVSGQMTLADLNG